jgi:Nif-specific regulatory protein
MPSNHRQSTARELKVLRLLFEISQTLDRSLDLRDTLDPVLKAIAGHMGMMRGTITLVNQEDSRITIEAAYGLSRSELQRGIYHIGEGITGKVVESGKPAVVPRISEAPLFLNRTGARKKLRKKDISFICVPIILGNEVLGTLSADQLFAPQIALEEDVQLLSTIASMVASSAKLRQKANEEHQRLLKDNVRLQDALKKKFRPSNIIGKSKAMQQVYDQIGAVTKGETTVLIRGESGVGKELVAQAIHYNSPRASRPFVKVNCAALSPSLLESELFGHEKGAFTGATRQRKGRFEMAHSGTIFLDEIGDFPLATQILLLRVIQEREFERVGGTETIKTDVRIVAATNRNLEEQMKQGLFREDLYYRLNVFPIFVPSLQKRRTDIPLLADFFTERYGRTCHKNISRISTPAIDMLMSYHWPGNVRELENCIERAVLMTDDDVIHSHHLPPTLQTADATGTLHAGTLQATLDNVERELIVEALKANNGNMTKAAIELGITERIMGLRVKKHNIKVRQYKTLQVLSA